MTATENNYILPADAAEKLLAAHDGDMALLYLYALRAGAVDAEAAAAALCRTRQEIEAAAEKLRRMGLAPGAPAAPARPLPPADELPSYTAADIARFSREDPLLQTIYDEAIRILGRNLSDNELSMFAGIYKHLGMPAEVVLLLLNDCAERAAERRPGAVPSPRSIEKEAYNWAGREILTLEQAEDYLRFRRRQRELTAQIKDVLNIRGRELVKGERDYVEHWLELGFGPEAVAIAYDRTILNKGERRWKYMNSILENWHAKKLHTPAEIEAGDGRRRAPSGGQPPVTEADYDFKNRL